MLKRFQAIFLLLSVLIVITHGMIPHQHEASTDLSIDIHHNNYHHHHDHRDNFHENDHHHNPVNKKDKDSPDNDRQDHDIPHHYHHSVTGGFDFTRVDQGNPARLRIHKPDYFSPQIIIDFHTGPPDPVKKIFSQRPHPVFSQFLSASNLLRAPPRIA